MGVEGHSRTSPFDAKWSSVIQRLATGAMYSEHVNNICSLSAPFATTKRSATATIVDPRKKSTHVGVGWIRQPEILLVEDGQLRTAAHRLVSTNHTRDELPDHGDPVLGGRRTVPERCRGKDTRRHSAAYVSCKDYLHIPIDMPMSLLGERHSMIILWCWTWNAASAVLDLEQPGVVGREWLSDAHCRSGLTTGPVAGHRAGFVPHDVSLPEAKR